MTTHCLGQEKIYKILLQINSSYFSKMVSYNSRNEPIYKIVKKLNIFHLNISSLPYHFPELHNLLVSTNFKSDVIGVTESKLNLNKKHLTTIDLPNYSIEHCPADRANGGALSYIKEDLIKVEK